MCRLLGYLGPAITLENILSKPEHSLIAQGYQPREMKFAKLNADGFGIGWYHPHKQTPPYTYRNTQPIWHDINLPHLCRYVESNCILGYVRSATGGLAVELSNCQPFSHDDWLFFHNGFVDDFRDTLYLPIRKILDEFAYKAIVGSTDSEHIFALILNALQQYPHLSIEQVLIQVLSQLSELAAVYQVRLTANLMLSNGKQLVTCRYANFNPLVSLYWLRDDPTFPDAVIIASEPIFEGNWNSYPEQSIITVGEDLEVNIYPIPTKNNL